MWLRILLSGLIGGVLIFVVGATNHMAFQLLDRTFHNIPDSPTFSESLKTRGLTPGFYVFPDMPTAAEQNDAAKMTELNERYKAGPAGMLLIAPTGQDMMTMETLGKELATNTIAALLVSWIISLFGPDIGFGRRWLAVVMIGVIGWCSFIASYGIWYRFPHEFVHDELICALLEWSVAGLAIAAISRRPPVIGQAVPV